MREFGQVWFKFLGQASFVMLFQFFDLAVFGLELATHLRNLAGKKMSCVIGALDSLAIAVFDEGIRKFLRYPLRDKRVAIFERYLEHARCAAIGAPTFINDGVL